MKISLNCRRTSRENIWVLSKCTSSLYILSTVFDEKTSELEVNTRVVGLYQIEYNLISFGAEKSSAGEHLGFIELYRDCVRIITMTIIACETHLWRLKYLLGYTHALTVQNRMLKTLLTSVDSEVRTQTVSIQYFAQSTMHRWGLIMEKVRSYSWQALLVAPSLCNSHYKFANYIDECAADSCYGSPASNHPSKESLHLWRH